MIDQAAIGERFGLAVVRATESTVTRGLAELDSGEVLQAGRVRRPGAGNKPVTETHPGIEEALERLVDSGTRGDPQSPLRWTSKSAAKLAEGLRELGHDVAGRTVSRLLGRMGYSLQADRKTREGAQHPDRDAQFEHINATVAVALAAGQPVISVDAKKRELVGDFKPSAASWPPTASPSRSARTTSRTSSWAMRSRSRSTTSAPTRAGSASASTTTPPSSPSPRSKAGGQTSALPATRTPRR